MHAVPLSYLHRVGSLRPHLADWILKEYRKIGHVDLPMLRLMSGERWQLTKLDLFKQDLNAASLKLLSGFAKTLQHLGLRMCKMEGKPPRSGFGALQSLKKLKSLTIHSCSGLSFQHMALCSDAFWAQLEELDLERATLKDLPSMPNMRCIALENVTVPDAAFHNFLGKLNRLISLTLYSMGPVLKNFAGPLCKLTHLYLCQTFVDVETGLGLPICFPKLCSLAFYRREAGKGFKKCEPLPAEVEALMKARKIYYVKGD